MYILKKEDHWIYLKKSQGYKLVGYQMLLNLERAIPKTEHDIQVNFLTYNSICGSYGSIADSISEQIDLNVGGEWDISHGLLSLFS